MNQYIVIYWFDIYTSILHCSFQTLSIQVLYSGWTEGFTRSEKGEETIKAQYPQILVTFTKNTAEVSRASALDVFEMNNSRAGVIVLSCKWKAKSKGPVTLLSVCIKPVTVMILFFFFFWCTQVLGHSQDWSSHLSSEGPMTWIIISFTNPITYIYIYSFMLLRYFM